MSGQMKDEGGAVAEAVRLTQEAQVDLNQRISQVTDDVAAAAAHFQGDGGSAFQLTMKAWNDAVNKLQKELVTFEENLTTTDKTMKQQDADQAQTFTSIRSGRL